MSKEHCKQMIYLNSNCINTDELLNSLDLYQKNIIYNKKFTFSYNSSSCFLISDLNKFNGAAIQPLKAAN